MTHMMYIHLNRPARCIPPHAYYTASSSEPVSESIDRGGLKILIIMCYVSGVTLLYTPLTGLYPAYTLK